MSYHLTYEELVRACGDNAMACLQALEEMGGISGHPVPGDLDMRIHKAIAALNHAADNDNNVIRLSDFGLI